MGALTDPRKRCLLDHHHCLPLSDDPPTPPFKKLKLSSSSSHPASHTMAPPPPPSPPLHRFPPASPLRRPVHGPQRTLKSFGLGSSTRPPLPLDPPTDEMRNLVLHRSKKPPLGLEEYKRLVVDAQEPPSPSPVPSQRQTEAPPAEELTVVEAGEPSDLYILDRKVEESGKVVLESTPVREEQWFPTRRYGSPLYKELYEASSRKFESILSGLAFEVKLAEEKRSSFRVIRETLAKEVKEDQHEPFTQLTDEEERVVNHALQGGRRHEVLVIHEASNIEITREILRCLKYGAWLNDEVINVYVGLLKEREIREPKRFLKCHFFNSFFYKKLYSVKTGYDFKAVKRWTSQRRLGYRLDECDKIFVPIHKEVHWCLAVINVQDKKFQYLDSLGGMDMTVLSVLARYFKEEVKDKSGKQINIKSWAQEAVEDLPLQKNGWDCGMFMLKYMDFYSRGLSLNFGQDHMEYFRRRTVKEILKLRAE